MITKDMLKLNRAAAARAGERLLKAHKAANETFKTSDSSWTTGDSSFLGREARQGDVLQEAADKMNSFYDMQARDLSERHGVFNGMHGYQSDDDLRVSFRTTGTRGAHSLQIREAGADDLVNINGMEMKVAQALDLGLLVQGSNGVEIDGDVAESYGLVGPKSE